MNRRTVAAILGTLGTILILSGVFNILPNNIAMFSAIACYICSGLAWWLPLGRDPRDR